MVQLFWHLTPVDKAAAYFFFPPHSEVARLIYEMKYHDRPDVGEDLGRLMAAEMQMAGFFDDIDLLVPVPLSPKRLRQRGYNQSEQLARGISQITGLPVCSGALKRRHFHASQTRLRRLERLDNVDHQFFLADDRLLAHRHVLLIDDVCTTGATLRASADALAGIEGIRISILTLAFTQH
jgi:ComF family protein